MPHFAPKVEFVGVFVVCFLIYLFIGGQGHMHAKA